MIRMHVDVEVILDTDDPLEAARHAQHLEHELDGALADTDLAASERAADVASWDVSTTLERATDEDTCAA
ncbi:MAG TPA: hypothetical protein VFA48_06250 [Gammaproteobacteria bacterium]|nr:hypothetical protein [Gammaproteobacteria bacterium]